MSLRLTNVVIDCRDLDRACTFWAAALGYERGSHGPGWQSLRAPGASPDVAAWRVHPQAPTVDLVVVPEDKSVKNRVHLDVTPVDGSRDDEVARLVALGATPVNIGQDDTRWVVLADPEGNEFCVMPVATDDT